MKALTLTQPWASLVALGRKRIETRSWSTNYTGPLAIHAAKGFPGWAKETREKEPFKSALIVHGLFQVLPVGQVLCVVTLMGCRRTEDVRKQLTEKELAFGDYYDGRFAWFLSDVKVFPKPIPAKGSLGLWEFKM